MPQTNAENFRLTVLNPGGRDPEQQFHSLPAPGEGPHPPINFHAFAACTLGAFHRDVRRAIGENTPVLLLLRSDFRASERALAELKREGRTVAVSLKETGLHQIAQQLRDPAKLSRFMKIVAQADGCIQRQLPALATRSRPATRSREVPQGRAQQSFLGFRRGERGRALVVAVLVWVPGVGTACGTPRVQSGAIRRRGLESAAIVILSV